MATEITWNTTDLSPETIDRILGVGTVASARAMGTAIAVRHCECRAAGWWDANEREYYAAWRSLARIV